jgi:hypothetical protein
MYIRQKLRQVEVLHQDDLICDRNDKQSVNQQETRD